MHCNCLLAYSNKSCASGRIGHRVANHRVRSQTRTEQLGKYAAITAVGNFRGHLPLPSPYRNCRRVRPQYPLVKESQMVGLIIHHIMKMSVQAR